MSRTEGVQLPRLSTSHVRVTSSRAMQPHAAAGSLRADTRRRSFTEPSYTAYVGTPRQDIPHPVFSDAAMYDDVFDKEGRLLSSRNTAKFTSPLNTVGYNSLNDPHCRKLFLNNRRLRSHLIDLGLITDDLKVVATTQEQRQKIRAHELLERKEMLAQKLQQREQARLQRLSQPFHLPQRYQESLARQEQSQEKWTRVQDLKTKKIIQKQEQERSERSRRLKQKRAELTAAINEARLREQAHRNALRAEQEIAEVRAYEKTYGKTAHWHREADRINNRMVALQLQWSKAKMKPNILSESFPPVSQSRRTSLTHQNETKVLSKHPATSTVPHTRTDQSQQGEVMTSREPVDPLSQRGEGGRDGERDTAGEKSTAKRSTAKEVETTETIREREGELHVQRVVQREEDMQPASQLESVVNERGEDKDMEKEQQHVVRDVEQSSTKHDKPEIKEPPSPALHTPSHTPQEAPVEQPQLTKVEGDQAKEELTKLLIEAFYSIDDERARYLSVDDFLQVLASRDLGFQLEETEQTYITSQVDAARSGMVAYVDVAPLVSELLFQIFAQRAEYSVQYYGYYADEEWVQIYPVSGGVVYLNKLTGTMQTARPDDYRPFLKDKVFEDSVVDFFETADTDRDGLIDYEDFYNLLASPLVASRVYRSQMEQLLGLYQALTTGTQGQMNIASFPTIANSLLLMIYQNAYPDVEEWIELESKKFGGFRLNKNTGEILLHQQTIEEPPAPMTLDSESATPSTVGREEEREEEGTMEPNEQRKSRKKKKHKKKKAVSDAENGSDSPIPTPRPKSPAPPQHDTPESLPDEQDTASFPSPHAREQTVLIKPVSSRSRLIEPTTFETIPEEDETGLDDSLVVTKTPSKEGGSDASTPTKQRESEQMVGQSDSKGVGTGETAGNTGEMKDQTLGKSEDDGKS